ncbi:MAG: hypothetical protein KDB63_07460 [Nocardioidaceae bacterium]|nr:hypothetical protein [Nocardioidaceae bacterium]
MPITTQSPIFTSEPMVTRALAAEIRHDPVCFTATIEDALRLTGGALGDLVDVSCEATDANLDVLLIYRASGEETRVGLEGKFDHSFSPEQMASERAALNGGHLVLILADATHRPSWVPSEVPSLTWAETLACFDDPRVTTTDVNSMPLTKATIDALLASQRIEDLLPADWIVDVRRNGNGSPSVVIESPDLPCGRRILAQVQTTGRWARLPREEIAYEYFTGISIGDPDDDLPLVDDPAALAPGWVAHLKTLHDKVFAGRTDELGVATDKRPSGGSDKDGNLTLAGRKMPFVKEHLANHRWVAMGFTNWALGAFSHTVAEDDLANLCQRMSTVVTDWYAAETGT